MKETNWLQGRALPPVWKEIRYAFYLIFHPFKGFWDIKHEKRGSLLTAGILLIAFLLSQVCSSLYTGYLFSSTDLEEFNLFKELFKWLFLFFGWCISNWCLTCLFEGEGTFLDICKATAYALVPMTVFSFVLMPLSHFFVLTEASFYTLLFNIGLWWTLGLVIIGMLTTHQYFVGKTVVISIFTIFGICIIAYIGLLFFDLLQQLFGFLSTVVQEIELRM